MNDEISNKEQEENLSADEELSADAFGTENDESENFPARRRILIVGGILALVFVLIFGYLRLSHSNTADSNTEEKTETVVGVKVAKVEKQPIAQEFKAIGTVAPIGQSTVAASISAQIKQMRHLKNQYVSQGEVLAILASKDLQSQREEANAALDEAKLNLQTLQKVLIPQTAAQTEKDLADAQAIADNARSTYERRKDLYDKGGLSLKELETSKLALTNAENTLRLARQNKSINQNAVNPNSRQIAENKIKQAEDRVKTIDAQNALAQVRAPISGIVTDQFQFEGEYAAAGAKLLTISATGEVIVKANFADTVVGNLQTGDAVSIFLSSAPDERMGGKITQISRSTDTSNRTVEVWANFANERGLLRTGDAVQFVVSANPSNDALIVPIAAVTLENPNSDEGTVMTVDAENVAHETKVKTGIKAGEKIQILEGLSEDKTVVIEGNYALPDGTKVEIQKDDAGGEN